MTLTFGIVVILGALAAWKLRGAQAGAMIYGAVAIKCVTPGSTIDQLAASGGNALTTVVTSLADALGGSGMALVMISHVIW